MKTFLFVLFLFLFYVNVHAQGTEPRLPIKDEFVHLLGPLEGFNVATIADTITRKFPDRKDKARAIFFWISNNISLDAKAIRSNDTKKTDPVVVIQTRKATPLGFATLFQEMCSMANIRCLVVDGFVKNNPEDINNKPDEVNHSWNVVQLGQSPEEWFFADAAKASGYLDKKLTVFTKRFTSEYFFPDKLLFNLDHFPDNLAWQLGGGPKSVKEFYAMPVICNAAYIYDLRKPLPFTGNIKTKTKNTISFSFNYNSNKPISNISFVTGEGSKQSKPEPINFTDKGGAISFNYQFKKDDTYPLRIIADGEEILQYYMEVSE